MTRINVDLRDNDENRTWELSIAILHSILPLREPWGKNMPLPEVILSQGINNFTELRCLNDRVLGRLLNDEALHGAGVLQ